MNPESAFSFPEFRLDSVLCSLFIGWILFWSLALGCGFLSFKDEKKLIRQGYLHLLWMYDFGKKLQMFGCKLHGNGRHVKQNAAKHIFIGKNLYIIKNFFLSFFHLNYALRQIPGFRKKSSVIRTIITFFPYLPVPQDFFLPFFVFSFCTRFVKIIF